MSYPASRKKVLLLSIAGAMVVTTAAAFAAIPDSSGLIHGCYDPRGHLRVVAIEGDCTASETPVSWSQTGPQGPQGSPGPAGEAPTRMLQYSLPISATPITAVLPATQTIYSGQLGALDFTVVPYLVLGKLDVSISSAGNAGATAEITCQLNVGAGVLDQSTLRLQVSTGVAAIGGGSLQGTLALQGVAFHPGDPFWLPLTITCGKDSAGTTAIVYRSRVLTLNADVGSAL